MQFFILYKKPLNLLQEASTGQWHLYQEVSAEDGRKKGDRIISVCCFTILFMGYLFYCFILYDCLSYCIFFQLVVMGKKAFFYGYSSIFSDVISK